MSELPQIRKGCLNRLMIRNLRMHVKKSQSDHNTNDMNKTKKGKE